MLLEFERSHRYNLIEESRIETECGFICQAQDLELFRTVAVKSVTIEGDGERQKQANYQRAFSEVRAMVGIGEESVRIPHIYETYYDRVHSVFYIIMEWVKGKTLADYMESPELQFLQWMIDLCEILTVMEKKHIYHKDIKPANIMISERRELFLIDFNISISTPNLVEGTVNYKAPEMWANSRYQGREKADMFAIGVMLYEYYGKSVPVRTIDYAKNRQRGSFEWDKFIEPKEKNEKICDVVNTIILKCMRLDPKQRYRNNGDLKNELMKAVNQIKWEQKKKR